MDFVRLGAVYSSVYVPDKLIENYSSLIWTERFQTHGEFELRTPAVNEVRNLLPLDALVSHLDTTEVMIVESHSIELDDEDVPTLVIKGRSLTVFLEHRYIEANYKKKRKMRRNYSAVAGLGVLLYNSFDNGSGKDVTRGDKDAETPELNDYPWNTLDKFANVSITDSVTLDGAGVAKRWWITEGNLWTQFSVFLVKHNIGLRTIRPSGTSGEIISVESALADRGLVTKTLTNDISSLRFDLYDGIDRSVEQTVVAPVQFSVLQGDLDKAQYFWSQAEYKTHVEIISSVGVADVYRNATQQDFEGIRRRSIEYDAGEPELPPEPQKPPELRDNATQAQRRARAEAMDRWIDKHAIWDNKRDIIVAEFREDVKEDALALLKKHRVSTVLSGDISPLSPYVYKVHYNLGDKITLYGSYGLAQTMVVQEYIRTEDANGDTGIPGLVLP